jgi:glycosyltransferase involved in cell wall biosynthesis
MCEIIAVNDGSTDHSASLLEAWQSRLPHLVVLHKTNGGCASARAHGLAHARGTYVSFIDPDDWVHTSMHNVLTALARSSEADIVQCGYVRFYEDTQSYVTQKEPSVLNTHQGVTRNTAQIQALAVDSDVAIWRRLYKTSFLRRHNISFNPRYARYDDTPFHFQTMVLCESFAWTKEPLYYYRLQRPGQSVGVNDERLYVHFDIFQQLHEFCMQHPHIKAHVWLLIVQWRAHIWSLLRIREDLFEVYLHKTLAQTRTVLTYCSFAQALRASMKNKPFCLLFAWMTLARCSRGYASLCSWKKRIQTWL